MSVSGVFTSFGLGFFSHVCLLYLDLPDDEQSQGPEFDFNVNRAKKKQFLNISAKQLEYFEFITLALRGYKSDVGTLIV